MLYFLIAAAAVAGVGAFTDGRTGHIPNWLTFGAFGAGILGNLIAGFVFGGWSGALWGVGLSLAGAALCAAVPALMYWKGAIGGGDIKLFAAIGALCQPMVGLEMETYALIAAAVMAPAQLAYKGLLFQTLGRSLSLVINPLRRQANRTEIPAEMMTWFRLGPAIFVGSALTVLLHWDPQ